MTSSWEDLYKKSLKEFSHVRDHFIYDGSTAEVGFIKSVKQGIAYVVGLPQLGYEELVYIKAQDQDYYGLAFDLLPDEVGVLLLSESEKIEVGMEVLRSGKTMSIPCGNDVLGRVINPLGKPLDGGSSYTSEALYPIERPAPAIIKRAPVSIPLQTGLKVIDALIPVGRGQRELILGDRQTGKTALAIDTMINQKDKDVLCVYCAIGQHASQLAKTIQQLRENGALAYTVVVATEGYQVPGLHYIAPYAATSLAEYFMEKGRDVLIVYDDLTNHARAYRELSLLLKRPPGREAFPGDIFYIHSRLLERSTKLKKEYGGGSLTSLPIVETEAQNLSAYIPTNLISITDGQIYLSPILFSLGIFPAVEVGRSVSRVGGKAQLLPYRCVTGDLKLAYSQFEELENFARFGTHLDKTTQRQLEHGKRVRACLIQKNLTPYSVTEQLVILLALNAGLFDLVPLEKMMELQDALIQNLRSNSKDWEHFIDPSKELTLEKKAKALSFVEEIIKRRYGA